MKTHYDVIVLGCGGIGSATAYWLARRAGREVLALEQFELGHHRGSSQDHSRIIRLSYHDPAYTCLVRDTFTTWAEVEAEAGVRIVTMTGGVVMARGDYAPLLAQYAEAMDAAGIPYERLDAAETMRRWPQFCLEPDMQVLVQDDTGIADAAKGNAVHQALARYHGATLRDRCQVTGIRPLADGVEVQTADGTFGCRRLVITAGAWTDLVLAPLGLHLGLTVTQEQVTYYATPNLRDFSIGRFPVWIVEAADAYYGFPVYGEVATKAAIDAAGPVVTAQTRTFEPDPVREQRLEGWLREHIPGFLGPKLYTKTCLYDMPRDRNFIVDALPEHPQILVCVGAGHAYKFASLLGKALSELALDGRTVCPIGPFSARRPAVTDPSFPPAFKI